MGFETMALIAASAYAGSELAKSGAAKKMKAPVPTQTAGPAPTTVMAAQRAEAVHEALLKRRRQVSTVMGNDYGALNVQQNKLGT